MPSDRQQSVDNFGHYQDVVEAITQGTVIPILSSGVNHCGRPKKNGKLVNWQACKFPPTEEELALYLLREAELENEYLCDTLTCDTDRDSRERCQLNREDVVTKITLASVSQYIALCKAKWLRNTLKNVIQSSYQPTPVHQFLAELPNILEEKCYAPPYPLTVTTCLDSVLEQAFISKNQPFDLVAFISTPEGGHFEHKKYTLTENGVKSEPKEHIRIPDANYEGISLADNPVILKLYGGVEFAHAKFCRKITIPEVTIAEDQLLDYLSQPNIEELLPKNLLSILRDRDRNLWFQEYSPSCWNLRIILHRIWREQLYNPVKQWWAIEENPEHLDPKFWEDKYQVELVNVDSMETYITDIENQLRSLKSTNCSLDKVSATSKEVRDKVFISYSHQDKGWLEKLKRMLAPLTNTGIIDGDDIWDDTKIKPGEEWRKKIEEALDLAKVAILMVSPNFLSSDFIDKHELPPLLEAAKEKGLTIFWIYVSSCNYQFTPIREYQAAHDVAKSLDRLEPAEQNFMLTEIVKNLHTVLKK
ncbi:MAG: toll/interleukin-1 receptor domain-containing protein [Synechococcus sp.]